MKGQLWRKFVRTFVGLSMVDFLYEWLYRDICRSEGNHVGPFVGICIGFKVSNVDLMQGYLSRKFCRNICKVSIAVI